LIIILFREVFEEAGIPHARGVDLSFSMQELANKIAKFFNEKPVNKMIVKLNHGTLINFRKVKNDYFKNNLFFKVSADKEMLF
jgi:hypothetical protein